MNYYSICPNTNKIAGKWNIIPGYFKDKLYYKYQLSWFCNETKTIHSNKNQYLKCKYCNK